VRHLASSLRSPFGVFLGIWFLSLGGSAALFSLYPILMQHVFGIAPSASSTVFAVAAALGILLYSPAGTWSDAVGPVRVLQAALFVRLAALCTLATLAIVGMGDMEWLVGVSFVLIVLSWSLLSVSGTALAARLSPVGEGEGMGLFNATYSVASMAGAMVGGWVAEWWGYAMMPLVSVIGVMAALLLSTQLRRNDA